MAIVGFEVGMRNIAFILLSALSMVIITGCSGETSFETIEQQDKKRAEVAKKMPGGDVPLDPADDGSRGGSEEPNTPGE
jgi:hypothetical protein